LHASSLGTLQPKGILSFDVSKIWTRTTQSVHGKSKCICSGVVRSEQTSGTWLANSQYEGSQGLPFIFFFFVEGLCIVWMGQLPHLYPLRLCSYAYLLGNICRAFCDNKKTHNKANPTRALVTQERPRFPGWPEWSNKQPAGLRPSSVLCPLSPPCLRASRREQGHVQSRRRRQRFSIARDSNPSEWAEKRHQTKAERGSIPTNDDAGRVEHLQEYREFLSKTK